MIETLEIAEKAQRVLLENYWPQGVMPGDYLALTQQLRTVTLTALAAKFDIAFEDDANAGTPTGQNGEGKVKSHTFSPAKKFSGGGSQTGTSQKILKMIQSTPEGLTVPEIVAATGLTRPNVQQAINRLSKKYHFKKVDRVGGDSPARGVAAKAYVMPPTA